MEIFQAPDNALGQLLSHIMITYLAKFQCTCIVSSVHSSVAFENTLSTMLNYASNIPLKSVINSTSAFPKFYLIMNECNVVENDGDDMPTKERSGNAGHKDAGTEETENFNKAVESGINFGCQAFIVSSGISKRFLDTYSTAIYTAKNRFASNHIVFVPEDDNAEEILAINHIFRHPVILDVPNILVIATPQTSSAGGDGVQVPSANNRNSFDLITSQFVGRFNNTSTILLDTFYGRNATFRQNANLFPDKLSNLEQRVVRLALFNYKPYTVWEEVAPGLGNANALHTDVEKTLLIDGTESLVLLEFCSKRNCTLEISLEDEGEWGEIYDDFTGTGVLGAVASQKADVGISALYEWYHEYQFLDFSTPITRTGITCIAPRPQLLSGLYLPVMPFSWPLWLAVIVSLLVGAFVMYAFGNLKQNHGTNHTEHLGAGTTLFKISAIYLLQSPDMIMKRLPDMFVLGCILLIGLMIGNAYSGGLASIMTVPQYEPPIDSAHQLAERNIDWGATQDAWIFSILLATQPDIVKLLSRFHPIPAEELEKRAASRDFAFSVERLPYGSFAIGEYIKESDIEYLQLMHYDIYYEYALAMTRKTWMLTPKLDELILNIVQSGIQKYWEFQVVMKYSDNKVQMGVSHSRSRHHENGPISLSASRLVGAFIIWIIGLAIASAAFILEIFYKELRLHIA